MAIFDLSTGRFLCECGCGEECRSYSSYCRGHNSRTEENKRLVSEALTGRVVPESVRRQISETLSGQVIPEEQRVRISNTLMGHTISEETRSRMSEGSRLARVEDPTIVSRTLSKVVPNKVERQLLDLLEEYFPGEWEFTGNGKLIIGGRCPDFSNIAGEKVVIEVFGSRFHGPGDEIYKIRHYKDYGYDCIVVWADRDYEIPFGWLKLEALIKPYSKERREGGRS